MALVRKARLDLKERKAQQVRLELPDHKARPGHKVRLVLLVRRDQPGLLVLPAQTGHKVRKARRAIKVCNGEVLTRLELHT